MTFYVIRTHYGKVRLEYHSARNVFQYLLYMLTKKCNNLLTILCSARNVHQGPKRPVRFREQGTILLTKKRVLN